MTSWADTFAGRTVGSGWGTASDGETWNVLGGSSTLSVGSGVGNAASPTSVQIMKLGSNTGTDMEGVVRWSLGVAANDQSGIFLRLVDTTHYYRLGPNGVGGLQLGKKAGGSFVSVATATNPLGSFTSGTLYWFRFRVIGSTLYGRVWADGSSEPTSLWHITGVDTSNTTGGVGLFVNPTTATPCTFDSFSVSTLISQTTIRSQHRAIGRTQ